MASLPIYAQKLPDVFRSLETCPEGLSKEEVEQRLSLYGANILAESSHSSIWYKWFLFVSHPMALLLWLAGGITFFTAHQALGLIIWMVVIINATFSFWREFQAEKAVDSLKYLLPTHVRVMRDGQESLLTADRLVPGDIILLAEGDHIPADARVIEEYGLRTNNSTLTGESMPSRKIADPSIREGLAEIERPNLVFAGTTVVSGTGRAVIYATGMQTQFGRIANLTQVVKEEPSHLQIEMKHLTRKISLIALLIGGIVFGIGTLNVGMPITDSFLLAIGIIVAAIPEGLAPTVTLSLAAAVQRMAQSGILIKKLSTVETLGAVSVICTDKSGTLTQNQMTVRNIWISGRKIQVSGRGYLPEGAFSPPLSQDDKPREFFVAAMLCNNARLMPPTVEQPKWSCLGDQTEAALKVLAVKAGFDERKLTLQYPRVHELPFDAHRKRMATIHRVDDGEIAFIKGAPKEVLQLCTHYSNDGQVVQLDAQVRAEILKANDEFARSSLRVLALARRDLPPRTGSYLAEGIEQNLTFLGLAAMMDPPRPDVAQAIQTFHSAGIKVVMITGDYGLTAESIARKTGMLSTTNPRILTGAELDEMEDPDLKPYLDEETVFARMAPEHKLRLVSTFQARGEVVAVIGDGVNDAPALRKADIGIAMGVNGTDVAKEAAGMILTDDNFGKVVIAIQEGRAVFDNLRKFITYIFASNAPEIIPFILTALFKIPLSLTVAQILAIDLGTDLFPALALGVEKPEPDIMLRPPRRRNQPLIDLHLFQRAYLWLGGLETILCYAGFFLVYNPLMNLKLDGLPGVVRTVLERPGGMLENQSLELASTVFFACLVFAQFGNAFACRSEKNNVRALGIYSNYYLIIAIGMEITLAGIIIYIPSFARLFGHVPLPVNYWLGIGLCAPILYGLERARKWVQNWLSTYHAGPPRNSGSWKEQTNIKSSETKYSAKMVISNVPSNPAGKARR